MKKYGFLLPVLAIILLSYPALFKNLGTHHLRIWDEATYANNAIDMLSAENIFVVEHMGKPDMYNTKPPFGIWMQALSMQVFGINEFGVRFPSALFGLLTILLVYFYCWYAFKSHATGFIAACILMSSKGYVGYHVVLTGDMDGMLILWTTLALLTFIDLVATKPVNRKLHYLILTIAFIFGFLTKSVAAFFFIPIMLLLVIISGSCFLLRDKQIYISSAIVFIVCLSFILIREFYAPGYLDAVWKSDIIRYNTEIMSWHVHPFDFYFKNLLNYRYTPYIYFLPLTIIALFIVKPGTFKLLFYLLIAATGFLLFISIPVIKLEWYDAPVYPVPAILLASSVFELAKHTALKLNVKTSPGKFELIVTIIVFLLIILPLRDNIKLNSYSEENIYYPELEGAYIKHLQRIWPGLKNLTIYKVESNEELYDQVVFYQRALAMAGKINIRITGKMDLQPGELVMVWKEEDKHLVSTKYDVREADHWNNGVVYEIVNGK